MPPRTRKESTMDDATVSPDTSPGQMNKEEPSTQDTVTGEVVYGDAYDTDALQAITSFEDAINLVGATLGYVADAAKEMGDGFALLSSDGAKARLVDKPIILMSWDFHAGDYGDEFASMRVVAQEDNGTVSKYIVNDGSSGVAKMLREYTNKSGRRGGLVVRHGFRSSEYDYCEECRSATCADTPDHLGRGYHKKATTYYIDTSL